MNMGNGRFYTRIRREFQLSRLQAFLKRQLDS